MRKKITYGLLTILLIGGLYLGLRFAFGLFTPFNFWTARQDIKNGKIQIAELGELPVNYKHQMLVEQINSQRLFRPIRDGTLYYNNLLP